MRLRESTFGAFRVRLAGALVPNKIRQRSRSPQLTLSRILSIDAKRQQINRYGFCCLNICFVLTVRTLFKD